MNGIEDLTLLAQAAARAVQSAAVSARSVQRELDSVRSVTKDDKSPVTVADYASQAIVTAVLLEELGGAFEADGVIAEEDAAFLLHTNNASYRNETLRAVHAVRPTMKLDTMLELIDQGAADLRKTTPTEFDPQELCEDAQARPRTPASVAPPRKAFWTLDPIDGTKGFLRGQQFAIALAFVVDGVPQVGALACPHLPLDPTADLDAADQRGSLYVAVRGHGVVELPCFPDPFARHASSDVTLPPPVVRRALEGSALVPMALLPSARTLASVRALPLSRDPGGFRFCASVEKAHSSVSDTDRVIQRTGANPLVVRLDSSAKYAVVARGQADAYLRLPTRKDYVERIWDHAAGHVVATEAGCIVSDVLGQALDFSRGRGLERNRGVVVSHPELHTVLIGAIRELDIT